MEHHFDIEHAKKFGIVEAVLIKNFQYWIGKNIANNTNFHDGRYWTFNSVDAWLKLFPYLSYDKLRRAIERLVNNGVLVKGNYNEDHTDRTTWYSLTDEYSPILQNCQMQSANLPNASGIDAKSNNTYNKHTNNNTPCHLTVTSPKGEDCDIQEVEVIKKDNDLFSSSGVEIETAKSVIKRVSENLDKVPNFEERMQQFEYIWDFYGKKVERARAERYWKRLKKNDREAVIKFIIEYVKATPDVQYRMNPCTLLNPANRRWEDEIINRDNNGNRNSGNEILTTDFDAINKGAEILSNFFNT